MKEKINHRIIMYNPCFKAHHVTLHYLTHGVWFFFLLSIIKVAVVRGVLLL